MGSNLMVNRHSDAKTINFNLIAYLHVNTDNNRSKFTTKEVDEFH